MSVFTNPQIQESDESQTTHSEPQGKVLVILGDKLERRHTCRLLVRLGLKPVETAHWHAAVTLIEQTHFDAILVDMRMPFPQRLNVTERIRICAREAESPIIAIGSHSINGRQPFMPADLSDYLLKPLTLQRLSDVLARQLDCALPLIHDGTASRLSHSRMKTPSAEIETKQVLRLATSLPLAEELPAEKTSKPSDRLVATPPSSSAPVHPLEDDRQTISQRHVLRNLDYSSEIARIKAANLGNHDDGCPPDARDGTRRYRVLIVDHDAHTCHQIARLLGVDYEFALALRGSDALCLAAEREIDIILIGLNFSGSDGVNLCRQLKSHYPTHAIPVIFLATNEDAGHESKAFDAGGVDFLTAPLRQDSLRSRVRTHLELKEARDLLVQLASIDPLTRLANRRCFDLCLESEWKRSQRANTSLTIGVFDVDYFKLFNDSYGHHRGDSCLRGIARVLQAVFRRPGDLVARVGGEEFAAVLPETDGHGAGHVIRKLLARIAGLHIEHATSEVSRFVTVSGGILTLQPSKDLDAVVAMQEADGLLYQAKQGGRNQCTHVDKTAGTNATIRAYG